jgi:hypothetical protein
MLISKERKEPMATISNLSMNITRVTDTSGDTCTITYSYKLKCSDEENAINMSYSMGCEIWGEDIKYHDKLGSPPYTEHSAVCSTPPNEYTQSFEVDCSVLDEDWGEDEIFIRLNGRSAAAVGGGTTEIVSNSPSVSSHF